MSAMSAPKITLFIFYTVYLIVYNEKLRITGTIYIKIKKFIIYSIYFADIKIYKITIVILNLRHKPYFIANYNYISYKVQFLRYSKNFVINCQK